MKSLVRQLTPDSDRSLRSRTAGCNSRRSAERSTRPLTGRRQPRWPVLTLTEPLLRSRFVFDKDYRPTAIASDPEGYNRNLIWDQANRITGITVPSTSAGAPTITIPGVTNALSVNQAYQYDALDRLISVIPGKAGATTAAAGLALLPKEV